MTPDEARKDCEICGGRTWLCQYCEGWRDGYEAAQRERGPIQAVGRIHPPAGEVADHLEQKGLVHRSAHAAMAKDTRRLVDHDDVVVLVQDGCFRAQPAVHFRCSPDRTGSVV